ncbi:TIM21-domain-containing protein [Schizophyllum amplum]|uniref:Mitochondrial import inner membrane translocase subunit Tim21 n=1 Tax=Schizophyllum amplum TaxID=97359 RepID=A0A550C5T6_9AGAR|nr:TIM21-domain-containing protein [Auriculariopsis ampla]
MRGALRLPARSFLTPSCARCSSPATFSRTRHLALAFRRRYATQRDGLNTSNQDGLNMSTASSFSQTLDQRQRARTRRDTVGPFQLGLSQPAAQEGVKPWSQLNAGGKAMRATARTTNLTVVLLGAGLSAILLYCLTTELFSTNSPTVLYNDACERITASPRVAQYLSGPLEFHNTPPSALRPKHRNRHISSQVVFDQAGREHMILSFYVEGKPPGYQGADASYLGQLSTWFNETMTTLADMSLEQLQNSVKQHATDVMDGGPNIGPTPESGAEKSKSSWGFSSLFGSLLSIKGTQSLGTSHAGGPVYTEGEVHADLIKLNSDGYFVWRYLLIDIPNSSSRNHVRVFVERGPGVRENEPVMKFNQH